MLKMPSQYARILTASLVSQIGSHLLTLSLAAYIYSSTGSAVKAAFVFVLSTLPATLLSSRLGHWLDENLDKALLVKVDVFAALITILCGLCMVYDLPIILGIILLAVRSVLSFVSRTGALKWIKEITPREKIAKRIQLYYLSFFISTAVSGVLASFLLRSGNLNAVIYVDVLTYVISILTLSGLSNLSLSTQSKTGSETGYSIGSTLAQIMRSPELRLSFAFICLSQCFFQGAYTCLVTVLPIMKFQLGTLGTGTFQIAASIGITLGFVLVWRTPGFLRRSPRYLKRSTILLSLLAGTSLAFASFAVSLHNSLIGFIGLNFFFECIWLYHSSIFMREAPSESAARFQFTLSAFSSFSMALIALAYSYLIDSYGIRNSTFVVIATALFLFIAFAYLPVRSAEPRELEVKI